ncbi:MAG: hypothetical protein CME71_02100 [Halobacteriovorax sp.]|nr:hypothetical protein [Halobacteriovorax sp.]
MVSKFPSENLAYDLITKVLRESPQHQLDVSVHVPLRMILTDLSILEPEERRFASYYKTHVDFLLFDKLTKEPKLVIEVDGVAFHKEGSEQARRDQMKDGILKKFDLSILRLRTDQSGEEERLRVAFSNV